MRAELLVCVTALAVLTGCGETTDPCAQVDPPTPGELASANAGRPVLDTGRDGIQCVLDRDGHWVADVD